MDQVAAGLGRFVMLAGEAGVGKTRLAEEAAREATTRGFRVWRGHCNSTEGAPPYLPFIEALRQYVTERPDDVLIDELGDSATEIARLVPDVARRIPVRGEMIPLPPEQERYRLLEAVADPASCLLLGHLAPTLGSAPVMVLATAREDEIGATHPISEPVAEFGRMQAYGRIGLSGLGVAEVEEMLGSLGAGPPPEGLARTVFEDTEGNAFFVTELISHLHAQGALLDESGAWRGDFAGGRWDVPDSVRAVIRRRVGRGRPPGADAGGRRRKTVQLRRPGRAGGGPSGCAARRAGGGRAAGDDRAGRALGGRLPLHAPPDPAPGR
jgi:hypothetical protein